MTVVEFKSNSGSVKVNAEDMPKITEKSKELLDPMKQMQQDAEAMKRRATITKIKVDKNFHAMTVNYGGSNKKRSKETTFTGYEEMVEKKYFKIQSLKSIFAKF